MQRRWLRFLIFLLATFLACTPTPDPTLRLYEFNCGQISFESLAWFDIQDDETDVRVGHVPCFVVEHPDGRLLWDGGLPSAVAETPGWHDLDEGMRQRLDRSLPDQLADLRLDMGSFRYVAFSHMHFDHCGTANEVEGATWIVQREEAAAAFADEVTTPGFEPEVYENLRHAERIEIDVDYDVFGDGRVRILAAPGHTPGHQVLFVDLENTGPVVLSGDLYHFALSRAERRVPLFNTDREATVESMERIERFVEETGAELWIEHELARFERGVKAPAFSD